MLKDILENLSNKKVFVTGASGFVGGRLIQVLATNPSIKIKALVRNYSNAIRISRYPIEIVQGDVTVYEEMKKYIKGCDIVFHCAYGNSGDWKTQKNVTVEGIKNIVEACIAQEVDRLVYVSTVAVYGYYTKGKITETLPYKYSKDSYSDSKIDAEKLLLRYMNNGCTSISIIQPTAIYGPWAPSYTVYPLQLMKQGRIIIPSDVNGFCNVVFIDDVIQALLLSSFKKEAIKEIFLISGEDKITWKDFYSFYEKMLKKPSLISLDYQEIVKAFKKQKKQKNSISIIVRLLRSEETIKILLSLPIVKYFYSLFRPLIKKEKRKLIRNKITSISFTESNSGNDDFNEIIYEELSDYKVRITAPVISIEKAKEKLDYKQHYDIEMGMRRTQQWAEWANLVE